MDRFILSARGIGLFYLALIGATEAEQDLLVGDHIERKIKDTCLGASFQDFNSTWWEFLFYRVSLISESSFL